MTREKWAEVVYFLKEFKSIAASRGILVIPRTINNEALVYLGITKAIRDQIILSLEPNNFCKGPQPDRDMPGELWFFGSTIPGEEIYIKLKIADANGIKLAKCLSFHAAEHKLKYFSY